MHGEASPLPEWFVAALDVSAECQLAMVAAVAPYVDASISKTINVPAGYPFVNFEGLYLSAWQAGVKGIATYRPNPVTGVVLMGR